MICILRKKEAASNQGRFSAVMMVSSSTGVAAIETFIDGWNERRPPLTWTKTAAEIVNNECSGPRTLFTRR